MPDREAAEARHRNGPVWFVLFRSTKPDPFGGRMFTAERSMASPTDLLDVHVNVEMTAGALAAIVENAKQIAGRDESGRYRVDTAEKAGEMISRFLATHDFEGFVKDINNYPRE